MSASEKNVKVLMEFGFTGNQARVYLAAVRLRLATAGQIAKVSKVRREDVYRILPTLEEKGLVEKILGKPNKIRATPVEEALSLLVKHEEDAAKERVSGLKAKTQTFLKHLAKAPRPKLDERTEFALLSHRENIMARLMGMLKNAVKEIDIVISRSQIIQLLHHLSAQLKKNLKKGVKIRLVSELPSYEDSLPRFIEEQLSPGNSLELRYTDSSSGHYIIVDFKEVLISTSVEGNLAEKPFLWTNSDSLLGVLQGDFENLWHKSTSWRSIEKNAIPAKVIGFMEHLRPTNHLIFLYDSQEAKNKILFNYLKAGFENGEAGVYVTSDENPRQIAEAMNKIGIPVEEYEKKGLLNILGYKEIYIIDGRFNSATTINFWNRFYKEAVNKGFKGLRVVGEVECFFEHNLIPELVEYEKALHATLDIPLIAICAYNVNQINKSKNSATLYGELARAHGTVLFTGLDNKLGRMEIRTL